MIDLCLLGKHRRSAMLLALVLASAVGVVTAAVVTVAPAPSVAAADEPVAVVVSVSGKWSVGTAVQRRVKPPQVLFQNARLTRDPGSTGALRYQCACDVPEQTCDVACTVDCATAGCDTWIARLLKATLSRFIAHEDAYVSAIGRGSETGESPVRGPVAVLELSGDTCDLRPILEPPAPARPYEVRLLRPTERGSIPVTRPVSIENTGDLVVRVPGVQPGVYGLEVSTKDATAEAYVLLSSPGSRDRLAEELARAVRAIDTRFAALDPAQRANFSRAALDVIARSGDARGEPAP